MATVPQTEEALPGVVISGENATSFSQADNQSGPLDVETRSTETVAVEPELPQVAEPTNQSGQRKRVRMTTAPTAVPAETIEGEKRAIEVAPAEDQSFTREGLDAQLRADLEALQQQQNVDVERLRGTEQNVSDLLTGLGQKGAFRSDLAEQLGVSGLEGQLAEIGSQIRAQAKLGPASLLKAESDVIGTGVTSAMLGVRMSNVQRDNAIKQLVLGAEQDSIQGRLGAANARIDRAVDAKFAPIEAALNVQKFNLDRLDQAVQRGDVRLSKKEDRQFKSQVSLIEKQEQSISETKALQATILKNQPDSQVRDAILSAGSVEEILNVPGVQRYMMSQAERLQVAKLQQDINNNDFAGAKGLTAKQRENLRKDPTSMKAQARIGVIKAVDDYKRQLRNFKGGNWDFNRLTNAEKTKLNAMLKTTIGPAMSVAAGMGAMAEGEAERFMGDLEPKRIKKTTRIESAAEGITSAQNTGLMNDFAAIDSFTPGATDAIPIFSDYKLSNMGDFDFFSEDFVMTDPATTNDSYFNF